MKGFSLVVLHDHLYFTQLFQIDPFLFWNEFQNKNIYKVESNYKERTNIIICIKIPPLKY